MLLDALLAVRDAGCGALALALDLLDALDEPEDEPGEALEDARAEEDPLEEDPLPLGAQPPADRPPPEGHPAPPW